MKRLVMFVSVMIGWVLVACGGEVVEETAVSSTATPIEEPTATAVVEPESVDPNRLYAVSDLSQVANTGKPQFLNSFANW